MTEYARKSSCVKEGWFSHIVQTYNKLVKAYPDIEIDLLKEKFGVLRFYIGNYPADENLRNHVVNIISEGEYGSSKICDVCGESGTTLVIGTHLLATRCSKHSNER